MRKCQFFSLVLSPSLSVSLSYFRCFFFSYFVTAFVLFSFRKLNENTNHNEMMKNSTGNGISQRNIVSVVALPSFDQSDDSDENELSWQIFGKPVISVMPSILNVSLWGRMCVEAVIISVCGLVMKHTQ